MEANMVVIEKRNKWDNYVEKMNWLLKARSKADAKVNNPYLYVNVRDGIAACTDGHRLHIMDLEAAEIPLIPDGDYEVFEQKKTRVVLRKADGVNFLDIWRIFSDRPTNGHYLSVHDYSERGSMLTTAIIELHDATGGQRYNADYVKDAMFPGEYKIECHPCHGTQVDMKMAVIGNEEMISVIMPYRHN